MYRICGYFTEAFRLFLSLRSMNEESIIIDPAPTGSINASVPIYTDRFQNVTNNMHVLVKATGLYMFESGV